MLNTDGLKWKQVVEQQIAKLFGSKRFYLLIQFGAKFMAGEWKDPVRSLCFTALSFPVKISHTDGCLTDTKCSLLLRCRATRKKAVDIISTMRHSASAAGHGRKGFLFWLVSVWSQITWDLSDFKWLH